MKCPAFTLVEMLVIIAIIGALATLATVSLVSSKEKARIAKAYSFNAGIHQSMEDGLLGSWELDECSGTATKDYSGFGGNAVVTNPVWSRDVIGGPGCSLSFDGSSYADISAPMRIYWDHFTLTSAFKSTSTGDDKILSNGVDFSVQLLDGYLRLVVLPSSVTLGTKRVDDGKWHSVTVVGDQKSIRVYLDGISKPEITAPAYIGTGSTMYRIGGGAGIGGEFNGLIDYVRVYDRAITE